MLDIAKSVGPVVNLKLLFDKDTGKSKGYAFVEYADAETAASAVRNLNNYTLGNRTIRCNFSNEPTITAGGANRTRKIVKPHSVIPPLPSGISLEDAPGISPESAVSAALRSLDSSRLGNLIRDSKDMATADPESMTRLLETNPQLAYALVEALLLSNSVSASDIEGIVVKQADPALAEFNALPQEQQNMIRQILTITDDQLNGVPSDQRAMIFQIKEKYQRAGIV